MSILALANVSASSTWVLLSDDASQVLATETWTSSESKDISAEYSQKLRSLLKISDTTPDSLQRLFVVNGPGSFTGLRNSISFCLGLSKSLKIPINALSTFEVVRRPHFIPARHQLARDLDLQQAIQMNLEFIEVRSADEFHVAPLSPALMSSQALVLGLMDRPKWPSPEEIRHAVLQFLNAPSSAEKSDRLDIRYGLNPKISGQRI